MKTLTQQHAKAARPADPAWDGMGDKWNERLGLDPGRETQLLDLWRDKRDYEARDALISAYTPMMEHAATANRFHTLLTPADKQAETRFTLVIELEKMQARGYGCDGSLETLHDYFYTTMRNRIIDAMRTALRSATGSKIHHAFSHRVSWHQKSSDGKSYAERTADKENPDAAAAREELNDLAARGDLSVRETEYIRALVGCGGEEVDGETRADLKFSKAAMSRTRTSAFRKMRAARRL